MLIKGDATSLAQEFTDDVYLSFEELEALLNYQNTQAVWHEIQAYRRPFEWQLKTSNQCFTLVLTPQLCAQCYALEQQIRFYQLLMGQRESSDYMLQAALNPETEQAFYLNHLKAYFKMLSCDQLTALTQMQVFAQIMAVRCFCHEDCLAAAAFCLQRYCLPSAADLLDLSLLACKDSTAEMIKMIHQAHQKLKVKLQLVKLKHSPFMNEGDVKELCARYPFLSDAQVQFYCAHRQAMHYYTVSDYAKWNQCSHETARTSLNELVKLGWYKKQKVGKKFVYLI